MLTVLAHSFSVLVHFISHELNNQAVGVLFVAVKVISEVLGVLIDKRHHILVEDVFFELIWEEASVFKEGKDCASQITHVCFGHLSADNFLMSINTFLSCPLLSILFSLVNSQALPFLFLHALNFGLLRLVQISVVILLTLHKTEFLLFEDFHSGALKCLSANDGEEGLYLVIEDEKFVIFDQSLLGNASQFWHSMGCRWSFNLKCSLATDFIHGCLISKLRDELVCLDVNILLTGGCLGSLHITGEKLFSSFCPLLLHGLGVVFCLIRVKQFVGVGTGRNDHSRVCASTVNTLIVHDVVRGVVLCGHMPIRILVLRFSLDNTRSGCESLWA